MTNVSIRTTADTDECIDTSDSGFPGFTSPPGTGAWTWGNAASYAPRLCSAGMIFRAVNAPSGATWDTVTNPPTVTFNPGNSATGNPVAVNWNGEESGTPADWADGSGPPDRTGTSVPVYHEYSPTTDTLEESPDLDAVLQEITDTAGAITDLAVWATSDEVGGGTNRGPVDGFADSSSVCPLFDGDYTAGGGGSSILPMVAAHYYQGAV